MLTLDDVDLLQPVNWAHPINRGRAAWWLPLPLRYGRPQCHNLISQVPAVWAAGTGISTPYGWSPQSYPGGSGSFLISGTGNNSPNSNASYLTIANCLALNPSYISLSAWIRTSQTTGIQAICSRDNPGTSSRVWQFRVNATKLEFIPFNASTNGDCLGTTTISDGNWHHVAATWDGVTIYVYVDGRQDGTSAFSGTLKSGQTDRALIGQDDTTLSDNFNGNVSNVSLWNRGLSATEVLGEYLASRQGYPDVLNRFTKNVFILSSSAVTTNVPLNPAGMTFSHPPVTVTANASIVLNPAGQALDAPAATPAAGASTGTYPGSMVAGAPPATATAGAAIDPTPGELVFDAPPTTTTGTATLLANPGGMVFAGAPVAVSTGAPANALTNPGGFVFTAAPVSVSAGATMDLNPAGQTFTAPSPAIAGSASTTSAPGTWALDAPPAVISGSAALSLLPAGAAWSAGPVSISTQSGTTNAPARSAGLVFVCPPVGVGASTPWPDFVFVEPTRSLVFNRKV